MANNKVIFDESKCISCKICYKACFADVIRWDEEKKKPIVAYENDCVHCTFCEALCPKGCFEVIADFDGERMYQSFDKYR
jgi:NAD-dependent dihydropyrimidine dehydrogenase PreA subunit